MIIFILNSRILSSQYILFSGEQFMDFEDTWPWNQNSKEEIQNLKLFLTAYFRTFNLKLVILTLNVFERCEIWASISRNGSIVTWITVLSQGVATSLAKRSDKDKVISIFWNRNKSWRKGCFILRVGFWLDEIGKRHYSFWTFSNLLSENILLNIDNTGVQIFYTEPPPPIFILVGPKKVLCLKQRLKGISWIFFC